MKRTLMLFIAGCIAISTISAQETPKWVRKNAISPNGQNIAFGYKGDIYVVNKNGGTPKQLTSNPAFDTNPLWSKDGKTIYFSSNRNGSFDLYSIDINGGHLKEITSIPGNLQPLTVLPNGNIIIRLNQLQDEKYGGFPGNPQLYEVNVNNGKYTEVTSLPVNNLTVNKNGVVLYEDYKGYEDPFRKHHTSSVTRDIWKYVPSKESKEGKDLSINGDGKFTKVTTYKGEDRQPVFAADGDTYYFLSERDGNTSNIYKSSLSHPEIVKQITFAEYDPIRYISVANDGTISYSYNGELYTIKEGEQPKRVDMKIYRDQDEKNVSKLNLTNGATSIAISPNGKEIALVLRGDVYVTSTDYNTTKRITNTPEQERNVCFSPDGRTLYYSSERNGNWGIYRTSLVDKKDKYFTYANKLKEELFTNPGETCFDPVVAPNGKWVAFFKNRTEIVVRDVNKTGEKSLMKDKSYSYSDGDLSLSISPDSRYILCNYMGDGAWHTQDVGLIDVKTGKITDLTESGYNDDMFKWAMNGKAMTWMTDKKGYRSHGSWGSYYDIYIMFFDGKTFNDFLKDKEDIEVDNILDGKTEEDIKKEETKEKKDSIKNKTPKFELDLVNRKDRTIRLTQWSTSILDYYLNNSGTMLYFLAPSGTDIALYAQDLKDNSVRVIQKGVSGAIIPSKDGNTIYVLSHKGVFSVNLNNGYTKSIAFNGEFDYKPKKERNYIFNHIWKQVVDKFYDPNIHGIDWDYYRDNYAKCLPYINNNYDFAELLSEMLGELNGSHTGARYFNLEDRKSNAPSYIGIFDDPTYKGEGVKIKEVLPQGPLNISNIKVVPGNIIQTIDGVKVNEGDNWRDLLKNKADKRVILGIKQGLKHIEVAVIPTSSIKNLLYNRWVKQREDMVQKLSNGKVGYVHIKGMDSESYRNLYEKALGKYRTCDALIVDTRHNGGGWLHDDLVTFLNGKAYVDYTPRGVYMATDPYNKWTKPSCVLMGEDNYSDASAFPYVYKTLKIGKLIGAPVPGTMTAVWWERQIDPSIVFGIPQVGTMGLKEKRYLENLQIEPDILVYNDPASELNGEDKQLEAAVAEMLKTIKK